jgi:hypothetical protein
MVVATDSMSKAQVWLTCSEQDNSRFDRSEAAAHVVRQAHQNEALAAAKTSSLRNFQIGFFNLELKNYQLLKISSS